MIRLATVSSSAVAEEHDAIPQQAGVDVVGPFATVGGLDDGGDEHRASCVLRNRAVA